jgi:hypothetical protein
MRGEETQILGALTHDLKAGTVDYAAHRIVLLPGTHSKWVRITGTTVTDFTTCMTGEIYALLTADSTLSRLAIRADRSHWEAFTRGLAIAGSPTGRGGILNTAFSARTLVMTGELAPDQVEDYLSGLAAKTRCSGAAPPASTLTRSDHRTRTGLPPTRCWSLSAPATTTTCGCSTARTWPSSRFTGDPTYGQDFARYLAAELACNPWSREVTVDCVGVAAEIAPMNPQRVRYHDTGADLAAEVLTDAVATIDRVAAVGHDVTTARAAQLGDDTWPSRLLMLDAAGPETPAMARLLRLVEEHPGRTATCVVVIGDRAATPGVVLDVTARGRVSIPHAGLDLVAAGLTSDEAQGCAALLAQSEDLADVEIPHDRNADSGWRSYSNAAGALRTEHTLPRETRAEEVDEPTQSVPDGPDEEYLRDGATTVEDLGALAHRSRPGSAASSRTPTRSWTPTSTRGLPATVTCPG